MVQTGADIQSAVLLKEIELQAGKNVKKGIGPAVRKLQHFGKPNIENAASKGRCKEVSRMTQQAARAKQGK